MMKSLALWKMIPAAAALLLLAAPAAAAAAPEAPAASGSERIVVCIDPGHQRHANLDPEPVAPGSAETKPKVAAGTQGVATKKPEYVLTLEVSLLLRERLKALGYEVAMTREEADADISNRARAELANEAGAQLFLRIHADGDASPHTKGLSVLYPGADSPAAPIAEASRNAAVIVEREMVRETGAASRGAIARNDLTGFNWSRMPTVLVEMGFMTNPDEDRRLSEPDYQAQLAAGMAAGADRYLRAVQASQAEEPFDRELAVSELTALAAEPGTDGEPEAYLAPQTVRATARRGAWYRIETWLGPMWLYNPALTSSPPRKSS